MKLLISPVCIEEARLAVSAGCDIIDIKNVAEGSLGAQRPWVTQEILSELSGTGVAFSAALGDLPNKPGTAGLAAYAVARLGLDYVKAGLYGATDHDEALAMMRAVVRSIRMVSDDIKAVACGYADYKRFGGVRCDQLVSASAKAGADVVMVDTAIKDGKNLFDALTFDEIKDFVERGHAAGMTVALAGSITLEHMDMLRKIGPDIIGVRGAVCEGGDRTRGISGARLRGLVELNRSVAASAGGGVGGK